MSDLHAKIVDLRARCARGEEVALDELREVIAAERIARTSAQLAVTKKKTAQTPMTDAALMDLFDK